MQHMRVIVFVSSAQLFELAFDPEIKLCFRQWITSDKKSKSTVYPTNTSLVRSAREIYIYSLYVHISYVDDVLFTALDCCALSQMSD